jgi:hypothetical protein
MNTEDRASEAATGAGEWIKLATHAQQAVSGLRHGDIEPALTEIGRTYRVAAQTVRRLVRAKRFLDLFSKDDPALARTLESCSFPVVETIARWSKWDRDGARDAARRFAEQQLSVRQAQMLERRARELRGPMPNDRIPKTLAATMIRALEAEMSRRHQILYKATWANMTFRPALRRMETPRFIQDLAFRGATMPFISLILTPEEATQSTRDIAVAIIHSHPQRVAAGLAAQLAGLWFLDCRGLLVSSDSEQAGFLKWIVEPYAEAGLEYFIPDFA